MLVFALLATLIPSVTTGWISYLQNERSLSAKITGELQGVSAQTAREVDLWVKERLYELRVFASSYEVSENLDRIQRPGGARAHRRLPGAAGRKPRRPGSGEHRPATDVSQSAAGLGEDDPPGERGSGRCAVGRCAQEGRRGVRRPDLSDGRAVPGRVDGEARFQRAPPAAATLRRRGGAVRPGVPHHRGRAPHRGLPLRSDRVDAPQPACRRRTPHARPGGHDARIPRARGRGGGGNHEGRAATRLGGAGGGPRERSLPRRRAAPP